MMHSDAQTKQDGRPLFSFFQLFRENEKRFVFQDFLACSENDADTLFDCFVSTINVKVE